MGAGWMDGRMDCLRIYIFINVYIYAYIYVLIIYVGCQALQASHAAGIRSDIVPQYIYTITKPPMSSLPYATPVGTVPEQDTSGRLKDDELVHPQITLELSTHRR